MILSKCIGQLLLCKARSIGGYHAQSKAPVMSQEIRASLFLFGSVYVVCVK